MPKPKPPRHLSTLRSTAVRKQIPVRGRGSPRHPHFPPMSGGPSVDGAFAPEVAGRIAGGRCHLRALRAAQNRLPDCSRSGDGPNQAAPKRSVSGGVVFSDAHSPPSPTLCYSSGYGSPAHCRACLEEFRKRYNRRRPHRALIPEEAGDPLVPEEVYREARSITIPRWQGWARGAKEKLDKMLGEAA